MALLRTSVSEVWYDWNAPLEGKKNFLYCDILGKVTTAVGYLCDSPAEACKIPWLHPDGSLATPEEIAAEWHAVKAGQWPASVAQQRTVLRLDDETMRSLTAQRLAANVAALALRFPRFASFPADAQLALCSMAWAMGAGFPVKFPRFSAAVDREDFAAAAAECKINETGNRGLIPRNARNKAHLLAAAERWNALDRLTDDP